MASKPAAAFAGDAPLTLPGGHPAAIRWLGWAVAVGAAASTVQQLIYLHPRYRAGAAAR